MRSTTRSFAMLAAVALGVALFGGKTFAAGYPERPIELIVPWGPGGGADQLARLVSKLMEPMLGQGIPVVNVPGGTGATGMAKLMAAPADGYSMAVYIADSHALLAGKNPRWTMSDITPVAVMIKGPSFLFVKEDSLIKTWEDFAKEAKANPGKLKVATLGFGSVDDFSLTVLERGGIKVIQVPFAKPSERYVSILGGHADALYEQAGDVAQFLIALHRQMRRSRRDIRRQSRQINGPDCRVGLGHCMGDCVSNHPLLVKIVVGNLCAFRIGFDRRKFRQLASQIFQEGAEIPRELFATDCAS